GVAVGRRHRCPAHLAVPRAAHLHDGGSAQHRLLHAPPVLREESRAHRRSRDQHRRDPPLHAHGRHALRGSPESRRVEWRRSQAGAPQDLRGSRRAMPPHILVVEDEESLLELLRYNFEKAGYAVETIADGDQAEARLKESVPDLLVLDWMLPGLSGIELCRRLRQAVSTKNLPIIMLTARGEEADRVRGFETGADDYVVKPFSVNELTARVAALLRRMRPLLVADVLTVGDIELNRTAMSVLRRGQTIHLGPTDYRLLEFFMQAPGRVFTRGQLLDGVWGNDVYVDERTVDVHIGRLRKALVRGWRTDPIRTVRGAGYSFEVR